MRKENVGLLLPLVKLFYIPNLLLSILLPQAEPAYDHAWQTFHPWKHCLFLAVICAAAEKRAQKNSTPLLSQKCQQNGHIDYLQPVSANTVQIWSSIQPTVCHHFLILILALFFLTLLVYLDTTSVSASVRNTATVEPNKTKGVFSCVYIHRHYFPFVPWLLICLCKLEHTWSCIKKKFCPEFWKGNWNIHNEKREEKNKIQVH